MVDVIREHIEIVSAAGTPKPRIAGHRIRVQDVAIWHEKLGMSADEIADQHPTITLADIRMARREHASCGSPRCCILER